MSGLHLHIDGTYYLKDGGHRLPYRAHLQMRDRPSAIEEDAKSIYIEFDHAGCSPRTVDWMTTLTPVEEQALYRAAAADAAGIFILRRHNRQPIDGEGRAS